MSTPEREATDGLSLITIIDPETKLGSIWETYKDIKTELTPDAARTRAQQIFSAAGVGEACAGIMKLMVFERQNKGGFSKPSKAEVERTATEAGKFVSLVRREVTSVPPGIELAYGFKLDIQKVIPVIVFSWEKTSVRLELDQAREHAKHLLGMAEAIQTDNFLHDFLGNQVGMEFAEVQDILHEFSLFRQRGKLEEISIEPISERLVRAMEATGDPKLADMIQKARAKYYDDFQSELAAPTVQLVEDLLAVGHEDLAERVKQGEFDGTPEESASWFEAEGKDMLPKEMWKEFRSD